MLISFTGSPVLPLAGFGLRGFCLEAEGCVKRSIDWRQPQPSG